MPGPSFRDARRTVGAPCQAAPALDLAHSRDDDGHVVSLLGRTGPEFSGTDQIFSKALGRHGAVAQDFLAQAIVAEFLALDFGAIEQDKAAAVNLMPNDWALISAALDQA